MTENQLDTLYAGLYQKYQLKIQEEKKQQQQQPEPTQKQSELPTYDEFSSNNFKNASAGQTIDMFE